MTERDQQALQQWLDAAPKGVVSVQLDLGDGIPTRYIVDKGKAQ